MGGPRPRPRQVILYCATERHSSTLKPTYVRNVRSVPHVLATVNPHLTAPKREKARIRATRTLTRLIHVASAGIVSASHIRPPSPRARGVTRPADQRASVAVHSSARCPHSSLRKHKRHPRRQCLAAIPHSLPRGCRVPTRDLFLCLYHLKVCPRQARLLSCQVIHVLVDECAGGVADVARPHS